MGFNNGNNINNYDRYIFKDVSIENILDLTDESVSQQLGVTEEMIKMIGDNEYEFTHKIGTWAKQHYKGIKYPGARGGTYENIVIFKQQDVTNALENITADEI